VGRLESVGGREQAGFRPVLILSQDIFNERSGPVMAVAITSQTQPAGFPLTLELRPPGLPQRSWVKISRIRTFSTERIGRKLGPAAPEAMDQIIEGLDEIIGA